jgi:hypothetical protein
MFIVSQAATIQATTIVAIAIAKAKMMLQWEAIKQ